MARSVFPGLLLLVLIVVPSVRATLAAAELAQAMLGPEVWSRVVEVRSDRPGRYPSRLYGTVFEFDEVLWFYTAVDGTQSLSIYRGRLERDKADLLPLFQEIDPAFSRVVERKDRARRSVRQPYPSLPNGCFVASLHELRQRLEAGEPIIEAGLLAVYHRLPNRAISGHTGLLFTTPDGRFFWDPEEPERVQLVDATEAASMLDVARTLQTERFRERISRARYVQVPAQQVERYAYARGERSRRVSPATRNAVTPVS